MLSFLHLIGRTFGILCYVLWKFGFSLSVSLLSSAFTITEHLSDFLFSSASLCSLHVLFYPTLYKCASLTL